MALMFTSFPPWNSLHGSRQYPRMVLAIILIPIIAILLSNILHSLMLSFTFFLPSQLSQSTRRSTSSARAWWHSLQRKAFSGIHPQRRFDHTFGIKPKIMKVSRIAGMPMIRMRKAQTLLKACGTMRNKRDTSPSRNGAWPKTFNDSSFSFHRSTYSRSIDSQESILYVVQHEHTLVSVLQTVQSFLPWLSGVNVWGSSISRITFALFISITLWSAPSYLHLEMFPVSTKE